MELKEVGTKLKRSVWINKEGQRKRIDKDLLDEYLLLGWTKGRK